MYRARERVSTLVKDWFNKLSLLELDYMEYSSNGLAQAAYVTNDSSAIYGSNIIPTMTSNTAPSPNIASASSEYTNPNYYAWAAFDGSESTRWDNNDQTSNGAWIKFNFGSGNTYTVTKLRFLPLLNCGPNSFKLQGSNNDSDWTDIYSGNTTSSETWKEFTFSNSTAYRYYRLYYNGSGYTVSSASIYKIEMMETVGTILQSYSENTIKTQGSYSLKGIALITTSLNKTLTKTFSPNINLTGIKIVKVDIRASRTGSNIKIGLHDTGGITTEITPNILVADTFQTIIWDFSAVSDANKNPIDTMIITIINANANNTFYIDNMYGLVLG